jgi:hypothetical protein
MKIDEIQRERLLSRLEREFPSGFRVPEELEGLKIKKRVLEVLKSGEKTKKEELMKELKMLEFKLTEKLKKDDISFEDGEKIVEKLMGLRKAIMMIEEEEESINEKIKKTRKEDFLRWKKFIEKIRGSAPPHQRKFEN